MSSQSSNGPTHMTPLQWNLKDPGAAEIWQKKKWRVQELKVEAGFEIAAGSIFLAGSIALLVFAISYTETNAYYSALLILPYTAGSGFFILSAGLFYLGIKRAYQYKVRSEELKKLGETPVDHRKEITEKLTQLRIERELYQTRATNISTQIEELEKYLS